ncbi:hypothetical protein CYMTET_18286 [Cymbomonas tetramitiformis]|uniref:Uncharacterized protein n=1 Tax=Cymbomonas tetramitiformis TaxID=36881 RepID=A0AAE0G8J8_9CHLO|nr:hypothetical protein CYMTET_18286 [Cymbomonas tetramitiformis]
MAVTPPVAPNRHETIDVLGEAVEISDGLYHQLDTAQDLSDSDEDSDGEWATPDNPMSYTNPEPVVDHQDARFEDMNEFNEDAEAEDKEVQDPNPCSSCDVPISATQRDECAKIKGERDEKRVTEVSKKPPVPPLTAEECNTIKETMRGLNITYKPRWASQLPEEQWIASARKQALSHGSPTS